jgi:hypothetical protein
MRIFMMTKRSIIKIPGTLVLRISGWAHVVGLSDFGSSGGRDGNAGRLICKVVGARARAIASFKSLRPTPY